jgi:exodeoxyribonuclease-5
MTGETTAAGERTSVDFSDDQAAALARIRATLRGAGVDLAEGALLPDGAPQEALAVLGRAGSGKTMLLAHVVAG